MRTDNIVRLEQASGQCVECRLQHICLARGWDPDSVKTMDRNVRRGRPVPRNDHLYRQGDRVQALYIIRSGSVKSYVSTLDGLEQVVRFHLPGEILGLDALGEDRHTSSAQALETSSICRISYDAIHDLFERYPVLRMRILRLASNEVSYGHARSVLLTQRAAEERMAAFLLQMSDHYAQRGFSASEFNLPMSRQDIASYLALAVETVSRLFTGFQNSGLLHVERRNIRLTSLEQLRALAYSSRLSAAN